MYYYSPTKNTFYLAQLKQDFINAKKFPGDAKSVDDTVWLEFAGNMPPKGKVRIAGTDGWPAWGDIPPPTIEELQHRAESQKRQFMRMAAEKIDICQDAVDLNIATDAEKSSLAEWRRYRVLLNRVDCTTAPDVKWPEQPK
ncbi:tail fiber assembly protein [Xenorhabdus bovienii]|uniref:tail fiber assembly protein n=1 Tax=Xenorhabdus bovienii TaxID=40576 RepID=UPI001EDFCAD9|nr:tail fiber assembly protein [Xenorhabdus bovienii]MCG3463708.1 tail fiber assembly protein [Xenorhabdus bovienii]